MRIKSVTLAFVMCLSIACTLGLTVDASAQKVTVAVVKDGELLFAKGYGELELGSGERVDAETRFSIGSTTKAMTVGAIGMLVDEGKIAWDDPVVKHLPWGRQIDWGERFEAYLKDAEVPAFFQQHGPDLRALVKLLAEGRALPWCHARL